MTQENQSQNASELSLSEAEAGAEKSLEAQAKAGTDAQAADHGQTDTQIDEAEADEAQKGAQTEESAPTQADAVVDVAIYEDDNWKNNAQLRKRVAASWAQTDFAVGKYEGNAGNIAIAMEIAHSLNISFALAMMEIHIMTTKNGTKVSLGGKLLLKMVREAGHLVEIKIEGDSKKNLVATCSIQRRREKNGEMKKDGEPHIETLSWAEAEESGLTKSNGKKGVFEKPTYKNFAKHMLRWRVVGAACSFACSDVLFGLSFKEVVDMDEDLLQGSQTKGIMGAANTPKEPTPEERAENATKSDARVVPNGSKD